MDAGADATPDRLAPARVRPAGRPARSASYLQARGRARRARRACRARPRPLPRAGAGGARAGRRPRPHARAARRPSAFDAGLPDSRRRLREALREVRDRDEPDRRAHAARRAEPRRRRRRRRSPSCSSRSWPTRPTRTCALAVEAAALDALMMLARAPRRARPPASTAIDLLARPRIRCSSASMLAHRAWVGIERGDARAPTSWARARAARRWRATCCSARRAGAPPTPCASRVLVMTDHPSGGARDRALREEAMTPRLAAAARRGGLVRRRARAAQRPGRRGREPRAARAGRSSTSR